jgi:DNA polymerase-3 subunit gamma/tau
VFENILGQERTVALLKSDIESDRLPSSLLFYGAPYTGKLSTALELSRVVSCREKGDWNCGCRSCREARLLTSPYTLMLGGRYFFEEIAASADTFLRNPSQATAFLYIRAVRKLLRRFDPVLWEGNEGKLKSVRSQVEALNESLDLIDPEQEIPDRKSLEKLIKANEERVEKISSASVSRNIPIDQIRNITFWCRSMGSDRPKFVIFEGADNMVDASRNALLKLLEEPPENCYLLLLTGRKGGLIQTILSRVRQYSFIQRSPESSSEVLTRIFRISESWESLRHFFLAWKGVRTEKLEEVSARVIATILEGGRYEVEEFDALLQDLSRSEQFIPFLEELTGRLSAMLRKEGPRDHPLVSAELIGKWNGHIRDAYMRKTAFNQSGPLLLETLMYRMADTLERECRRA